MTEKDKIRAKITDSRLAQYEKEEYYGWYDDVYLFAEGQEQHIPWYRGGPNKLLVSWLNRERINGNGQKAIVVGCGLGDDAEELVRRGFSVTAFDVSEKAIRWAGKRFPDSEVRYEAADLFNYPPEWKGSFDFAVESSTLQSLPIEIRPKAMKQVASLVAQAGAALVLCFGRTTDENPFDSPPWPLHRDELDVFTQSGLMEKKFEELQDKNPSRRGDKRFRVLYTKP